MFIERLWRSLKYECAYLQAFETRSELRAGLTRWIGYTTRGDLTRPWAGAHPTRRMGSIRWRDWRPNDNQNQA